jgi:branched-subunit amino acid aminotransferase/4-amino-4-deoxychorismate lyase
MEFKYYSKNGTPAPIAEAVVPLSNIEYQYGFGVYETIRVVNGTPYFIKDHAERLGESARIIGLEHPYAPGFVELAVRTLMATIAPESYNLKILLIGSAAKETALLYVLPLNPLFPDRQLYSEGVKCITYPCLSQGLARKCLRRASRECRRADN